MEQEPLEIEPELLDLARQLANRVKDVRHEEEESRTGRVTIPDWPMSGREITRLRKRNDNRERWDRHLR